MEMSKPCAAGLLARSDDYPISISNPA